MDLTPEEQAKIREVRDKIAVLTTQQDKWYKELEASLPLEVGCENWLWDAVWNCSDPEDPEDSEACFVGALGNIKLRT